MIGCARFRKLSLGVATPFLSLAGEGHGMAVSNEASIAEAATIDADCMLKLLVTGAQSTLW